MVVGCLALNASFEPLTMVPMRRALRLVLDGKAEIVESDPGRLVRSERLTLPRPAVIRLMKFIHVPRRFRRQVTNTFLFARDRYRCQYCGRTQVELKPRESLTRDHLIPISRGGTNEWTNVVTACSPVQHAQGQPHARGNRHAPDDASGRAALRASELGGAPPHAGAVELHSSCSTARRRCTSSSTLSARDTARSRSESRARVTPATPQRGRNTFERAS